MGKAPESASEVFWSSVHPHTRGESGPCSDLPEGNGRFTPTLVGKANCSATTSGPHCGSPPHSWGKLNALFGHIVRMTVHPHTRGESGNCLPPPPPPSRFTPTLVGKAPFAGSFEGSTFGSPPHSWGKHVEKIVILCYDRFTPTLVGKASHCDHSAETRLVHPHTRGESGCIRSRSLLITSVHPHTRGESASWRSVSFLGFGSPPHSWGKLAVPDWVTAVPRFTPTLVGKAPRRCRGWSPCPVHPHTRGESDRGRRFVDWGLRFTPTLVGKARSEIKTGLFHRFTPTLVGKAAGWSR